MNVRMCFPRKNIAVYLITNGVRISTLKREENAEVEKNKLISVSIIMLAISIVFGSVFIGTGLKNPEQDDILELGEAAKYLRLSEGDLLYMIRGNDFGINYVEINGKYIFSREGLHEWVKTRQLKIQR